MQMQFPSNCCNCNGQKNNNEKMEDFNMVIMLSAGEIPEFTHLLPPLVGVAE